jgi:lipoprotein-releasing system ATP-binding protein
MSDRDTPLLLRDLRRTYRTEAGELPVLRGVDLSLRAGEIVALMAPSGAGKSTLLHLAGLLERPDGGSVIVEGRNAGALPDAARTAIRRDTIGFVYQFHHLLGEFTALENVVLPQMIAGRSRRAASERAMALLRAFGLGARAGHLPGKLSGGNSAWRLRALWPMRRGCCWRTSPPATWTSRPRMSCSASCWRQRGARAWRR